MRSEYILPVILGIGTGLLILCVVFLLHKLFIKNGGTRSENRRSRRHKKSSVAMPPTIIPQNIPGFMLPTWRNVRVQEPLKKTSGLVDDLSSDEVDLEFMKPRNNNNAPVSTVLAAGQSTPELREILKMTPISPLKKKSLRRMNGSISLQDLNLPSPTSRQWRQSLSSEDMVPRLKFALYYSVATSELNVTVISVHNLAQFVNRSEFANLCVWVQVEFSKYHQEFCTKSCSSASNETVFHEACVVSDFPVEHFTGTKISFRVLENDATAIAEAIYIVVGLPPSFPRNETIELQHPGIVQSSQSANNGEMLVNLRYDSVDETVTLGIVECRGLKHGRKKSKLLDTYVKVHVIFCDQKVQRFKTKLVQKSNSPKYEETFTLAGFFSRTKMAQTLVKLTVFVKAVPQYSLGYIILGTSVPQVDKTSSGYQQWETIIDKPQLDIAQWHALKPTRSMTP